MVNSVFLMAAISAGVVGIIAAWLIAAARTRACPVRPGFSRRTFGGFRRAQKNARGIAVFAAAGQKNRYGDRPMRGVSCIAF